MKCGYLLDFQNVQGPKLQCLLKVKGDKLSIDFFRMLEITFQLF